MIFIAQYSKFDTVMNHNINIFEDRGLTKGLQITGSRGTDMVEEDIDGPYLFFVSHPPITSKAAGEKKTKNQVPHSGNLRSNQETISRN